MFSTREKRNKSMLYDYGTTSRIDYRYNEIKAYPPTIYKPKDICLRTRPPHLKYAETLYDWKPENAIPPFNLFHKPKRILQTDPRKALKSDLTLTDEKRAEVQRTRPRVFLTPAISMDDVEEPTRQFLINTSYSSTTKRAMQEGAMFAFDPSHDIRSPLTNVYAPANVIHVPPLREPYVSPEWRMDSVSWDAAQRRGYVNPTESFWVNRGKNK